MSESLHDQLVRRALTWLVNKQNCVAAISEMGTVNLEIPDVIGWCYGGNSILIECKVSKSDFNADSRKCFRRDASLGMGNLRYYMSWAGVIQIDDLPTGWGLLWVKGRSVKILKMSGKFQSNRIAEVNLLLSALRRKRDDELMNVCWYQYTGKRNARVCLPPLQKENIDAKEVS